VEASGLALLSSFVVTKVRLAAVAKVQEPSLTVYTSSPHFPLLLRPLCPRSTDFSHPPRNRLLSPSCTSFDALQVQAMQIFVKSAYCCSSCSTGPLGGGVDVQAAGARRGRKNGRNWCWESLEEQGQGEGMLQESRLLTIFFLLALPAYSPHGKDVRPLPAS
jgi:hypothetical protein